MNKEERVSVTVKKELYDELALSIVGEYDNSEEGIESELDDAISWWIRRPRHAHTQFDSRGFKTIEKIMDTLSEMDRKTDVDLVNSIPTGVLEHAIIQVAGADERTIKKYVKLLEKVRKIEKKNPTTYKRLFIY